MALTADSFFEVEKTNMQILEVSFNFFMAASFGLAWLGGPRQFLCAASIIWTLIFFWSVQPHLQINKSNFNEHGVPHSLDFDIFIR